MKQFLSRIVLGFIVIAIALGVNIFAERQTVAAAEGEFYLQVSPSPIVATLQPGHATTLELKIRNAGANAEKLKIQPRSFSINNTSGEVEFKDTTPPEIAKWLHFSALTFNVEPGQFYEQKVTVDVPKEAGFSYSFALLITRDGGDVMSGAGQQLKGQVAVFALLNIDRPGAVRQLVIDSISTDREVYEFLPATVNIRLKNTGNTIVQPAGNVFIQRGSNDPTPIDTLAVNNTSGYILPNVTRTLNAPWDNGFLVNRKSTDQNGTSREYLDWNWSNAGKIRIGYYTAKVVAVYNDGQRDVPVVGEVGFWVIPWRLLLGVLIMLALVGAGMWSLASRIMRLSGPYRPKSSKIKRIKR